MGDPKDKLAEKLSWSMEEARVKILADPLSKISKHRSVPYHAWPFRFVLQLDWGRVDDLLRPYTQSSPFSTDLVYKASFLPSSTDTWLILILNTQAVLQGEFSVISAAKGMYGNDMLNGKQISVLEEAIRAYRLFVKLVLLPHLPKVYPTYAVDLVWHTHQLQGPEYK